MVETTGNLLGESQFDSRKWSVLIPIFMKFVLESSGGLKFMILVKDFDTGRPSLITVKKKYLFCFSILILGA